MQKVVSILMIGFSIIIGTGRVSAEEYKADENTVLLFHFNEVSGEKAYVESKMDVHNGNLINMDFSRDSVEGKYNRALKFNGKDQCVVVHWTEDFRSISNQITVEAWIKLTKENQYYPSIVYRESRWNLRITDQNRVQFWIGPYVDKSIISKSILSTGRWYHVAGVYDGKRISLFINGKLDLSEEATGNLRIELKYPIYIGCDKGYGRYFNGVIDEVRVSNIARTEADFATVREEGRKKETALPKEREIENTSTLNSLSRKIIKPCWGINAHERYTDEEFPILKELGEAGLETVIFSYSWREIEKSKGVYTFNAPSGWWGLKAKDGTLLSIDDYLSSLKKFGIRLVCVLTNNIGKEIKQNVWYLKQPYEPVKGLPSFQPRFGDSKYVEAFGEYCAQMARRYGKKGMNLIREWEVWNEPNGNLSAVEKSQPGVYSKVVKSYVRILKQAYKRIKQEDPQAKVIGIGASRIDFRFIEDCLKLGAGDYMDALSIHPYRESTYPEDRFHPESYGAPEGRCHTYAEEIAYLRSIIKKYSPEKEIELWITEMGYSIFNRYKRGIDVSPFTQAKYLARFCIQNLALGIDNIIWYQLRDFGNTNYDDSNGITSNCIPKPAYYTFLRICKLFNQNLRILPVKIKTTKKVPNLHQYIKSKRRLQRSSY